MPVSCVPNFYVDPFLLFLLSVDCYELPSCPKARKLIITLQCSLNMLEGDTGYELLLVSF